MTSRRASPRSAAPGPGALRIGAGMADISVYEHETEMLGWANSKNLPRGVTFPLQVRAFVLQQPDGGTLTLVSAEIAFFTQSLRDGVLERLQAELPELNAHDANVLVAATHTHSGPGGFAFDMLYTLPTPGFRGAVHDGIVDGIVRAVQAAWASRRTGTARLVVEPVPPGEPVAFNRSIEAYNRNPDIARRVDEDTRHLGVNRDMALLFFEGADGVPIGAWSFFAVHCTSVHADHTGLHSDNKGYAADLLEQWARQTFDAPDFVGAFAQGAAGDVSPNFRWCPERGIRVGAFDDDDASARFNGQIQADHAQRLCVRARNAAPLEARVDGVLTWLDFAGAPVDPEYADGIEERRTGFARMGLPFIEGTAEGPGPLRPLRGLSAALSRAVALRTGLQAALGPRPDGLLDSHGPMYPFLEVGRGGEGRAFGAFSMGQPFLPEWFDPGVAQVRQISEQGMMGDRPWVPNVLPVQLVRIGSFVIAGIPGEPTTQAGRRVERDLATRLRPHGVERVFAVGYTNGYSAYITTREEYLAQQYEGGATIFGQWTLGAYRTRFREMAKLLRVPPSDRRYHPGPRPALPSRAELEARRPENLRLRRNWIR